MVISLVKDYYGHISSRCRISTSSFVSEFISCKFKSLDFHDDFIFVRMFSVKFICIVNPRWFVWWPQWELCLFCFHCKINVLSHLYMILLLTWFACFLGKWTLPFYLLLLQDTFLFWWKILEGNGFVIPPFLIE